MLKAKLNELVIQLDLVPEGPLLVKGRQKSKEEKERLERVEGKAPPDMDWIKIGDQPFIPGSSLKGILRSNAEKMARSLAKNFGCCNPFVPVGEALKLIGEESPSWEASWEASCSDKFERRRAEANSLAFYAEACPVCKLFGCSKLAGRLVCDDAYPLLAEGENYNPETYLERRDGVGISRYTGAAAEGLKYDLEVMVKGRFALTCYLHNFERWQAGLLISLLRDLAEARLRLGYGKRRGLGKVKAETKEINLTYYGYYPKGCSQENPVIAGIGSLAGSWLERHKEYAFSDPADLPLVPVENVLQRSFPLPVDLNLPIWEELVKNWHDYIKEYSLPDKMGPAYFNSREVNNGA